MTIDPIDPEEALEELPFLKESAIDTENAEVLNDEEEEAAYWPTPPEVYPEEYAKLRKSFNNRNQDLSKD